MEDALLEIALRLWHITFIIAALLGAVLFGACRND